MIATHVSSILEATEGNSLRLVQSFLSDDVISDHANPQVFAVPPLTSKIIDFCGITSGKHVFLKTDKPVYVTMTFAPSAPTPPPIPAINTVVVNGLLALTTEISDMTITNPNSGISPNDDATVTLLLIGT